MPYNNIGYQPVNMAAYQAPYNQFTQPFANQFANQFATYGNMPQLFSQMAWAGQSQGLPQGLPQGVPQSLPWQQPTAGHPDTAIQSYAPWINQLTQQFGVGNPGIPSFFNGFNNGSHRVGSTAPTMPTSPFPSHFPNSFQAQQPAQAFSPANRLTGFARPLQEDFDPQHQPENSQKEILAALIKKLPALLGLSGEEEIQPFTEDLNQYYQTPSSESERDQLLYELVQLLSLFNEEDLSTTDRAALSLAVQNVLASDEPYKMSNGNALPFIQAVQNNLQYDQGYSQANARTLTGARAQELHHTGSTNPADFKRWQMSREDALKYRTNYENGKLDDVLASTANSTAGTYNRRNWCWAGVKMSLRNAGVNTATLTSDAAYKAPGDFARDPHIYEELIGVSEKDAPIGSIFVYERGGKVSGEWGHIAIKTGEDEKGLYVSSDHNEHYGPNGLYPGEASGNGRFRIFIVKDPNAQGAEKPTAVIVETNNSRPTSSNTTNTTTSDAGTFIGAGSTVAEDTSVAAKPAVTPIASTVQSTPPPQTNTQASAQPSPQPSATPAKPAANPPASPPAQSNKPAAKPTAKPADK